MHRIGKKVPEDCVYVGRPSPWGNPYAKGPHADREDVINKFRDYAEKRIQMEPEWLSPLKGATALVCWCSPLPCHAQVLLDLLDAG